MWSGKPFGSEDCRPAHLLLARVDEQKRGEKIISTGQGERKDRAEGGERIKRRKAQVEKT